MSMIPSLPVGSKAFSREVRVPLAHGEMQGLLFSCNDPQGAVVIGSASAISRFSRRAQVVATQLMHAGFTVLVVDLLEEEEEEAVIGHRVDRMMVAERFHASAAWLCAALPKRVSSVGLLGFSAATEGALVAAKQAPQFIASVVCRAQQSDLPPSWEEFATGVPTLWALEAADAPAPTSATNRPDNIHIQVGSGEGWEVDRFVTQAVEFFKEHLAVGPQFQPHRNRVDVLHSAAVFAPTKE